MNISRYLLMAGLTAAAFLTVYVLKIPLRRSEKKIFRILFWFVKLAVLIWLAYLLIAYASPFLWRYGYAVGALYLALLGDLFSDLIMLFLPHKTGYRKYIAGLMTILVSVYAGNTAAVRSDDEIISYSCLA